MEWTDIRITVPQQYAETAEAIATMVSNGGIYIEDYSDLEQQAWEIAHVDLIEQELLDKPRDIVIVHMYLAPDENPAEVLPLFRERLDAAGVPYTLDTAGVQQEDWQNAWKKYYHAMDIGSRLAIVPGWESYDTDRIRITMDPGLAFGTGTHETTALCLELLDSLVQGGGHRPHVRAHRRRERGTQRRGRPLPGAGGRSVRQSRGRLRHHHRQHRGGSHPVAGTGGTRPDGAGGKVHLLRHH